MARHKRVKKKTINAVQIMERMIGDDVVLRRHAEVAHVNVAVAQLIFQARQASGLTQKELADLIGTKQPVIARLENADYEGHSLTMLQRIATALNRRLEIQLKPVHQKKAA